MDASQVSAEWDRCGGEWYRRVPLYSSVFDGQEVDLGRHAAAAAPYGGAIALWKDTSKLQTLRPGTSPTPLLSVYSLAGQQTGQPPLLNVPWDAKTSAPAPGGLGWSYDERVVCVLTDGNVRCYTLDGDFTQFSLGHNAETLGVVDCRFYPGDGDGGLAGDGGFVAMLSNYSFIAVTSYHEPRPRLLPSLPSHLLAQEGGPTRKDGASGPIHAWTVVPPQYSLSRSVECLLSVGPTIWSLDATDSEDRLLTIGPFHEISVSPDGRSILLYTTSGVALVVSSDFQERWLRHDCQSQIPPKRVAWAGSQAAVVAWEDEVRVIGDGEEKITYLYDTECIHLFSDVDGAVVLMNESCELIQPVPRSTREVFGSFVASPPAQILLDAVQQLERQSPKADDYIQLIRGNLAEAVSTCVRAAGHEFDVSWQKQLLRAASLGKSVLDLSTTSDDFVEMCETLRVLNAVRYYEVGLPITYEQFQHLTPDGLLQRLVRRRQYLLALRIAEYLRLPSHSVYTQWAIARVRFGRGDDEESICREVVDRVQGQVGISLEAIARAAWGEGRARLATKLLQHEPRSGRQVPLLMDMEEDELALDRAVESGDSDLVLSVLLALRKKLPLAAFFQRINGRPAATALVEKLAAQEGDHALLKDLYYQDDRPLDGAAVFIHEALQQPTAQTAADKLAIAATTLADAKEAAVERQALRETTLLLKTQETLGRDLTDRFTGLSTHETLFRLIRLGLYAKAKKVAGEFRVPERVLWWIRLRALMAKRDWDEVRDWTKAAGKKSPIGWLPFYRALLAAGNPTLAAAFVAKSAAQGELAAEPGGATALYEACGQWKLAAEEAVRERNREAFTRILAAAGEDTALGREIAQLGGSIQWRH